MQLRSQISSHPSVASTSIIYKLQTEIRVISRKSKTILLNEKNTKGSVSTRVPYINKSLRKMIKTNLNEGLDKTIKWYLDNEKRN